MESQVIETKRGFMMVKKISGVVFPVSFLLCGCGVENIMGTTEQKIAWLSLFVIMAVSAFCFGGRHE